MLITRLFKFFTGQYRKIEFYLFLIGITLLASAPAISIIFLIFPIISGFKKNFLNLIKDKFNYLLFAASLLMIIKSILSFLTFGNRFYDLDPYLNWIGLANWIPLFFIYMGSQNLVKNSQQREAVSKCLILGTLPVIFSCLTQYFLKWYGPYELLNGLIIWYQRPRPSLYQPTTGLFSNPNITGCWLAMNWTFLLYYLNKFRLNQTKIIYFLIFTLSVFFIFTLALVNSRGAWLGILISIPLIFGRKIFYWFIPLILLLILIVIICISPNSPENIQNFLQVIIPQNLLTNFNDLNFSLEKTPRLLIWSKSLEFILQKPFWGWGAATFPEIFLAKTGLWKAHPHNLFFELSISYGLITSIIVFFFMGLIILRSSQIISLDFSKKGNVEKAWWSSVIIFMIFHLFDIVYFDLRISILFWILLAGLRGIIIETRNFNYK